MIRFLKAQASSLIATGVDYSITILLKEVFDVDPLMAIAIGAMAGGITNFYINRDWVFNGNEKELRLQAARYIVIWFGSLLLNISGSWLFTQYGLNYVNSKILASLIVGWTYNYFLQKKFVFK